MADGLQGPLATLGEAAVTPFDDHSRFAIVLEACVNERTETVQECLTAAFRTYGLPARMLMDNGSPWGNDALHPRTPLTVWLMHLGIQVSHGRPYHPQTQGKEERFHRTLNAEVLQGRYFTDCPACQAGLVARRLQHASAPGVGPCDADQPLRAESPELS